MSLDRLAQEYSVTIERRPFLLRPDTPPEGMPREFRPGETGDQLREPLASRAQQEGLIMRRPSMTPSTLLVLEATEYAREQGLDGAFFQNTMRAYWEEGVDLGDMAVLQRLAGDSGLEWTKLSAHLDSGHYRTRVLDQHREAVEMGIQGIPAFLIGNQLFTGAQPYETFKMVMDRALAQSR